MSAQQSRASKKPYKHLLPRSALNVCTQLKLRVVGRFKRWPKEFLQLIKLRLERFSEQPLNQRIRHS